MRAAVLHELNKPMTIEELELRSPGRREVLVKMVASGVCHTDVSISEGTLFMMQKPPLPIILGHEGAGIVEEIGEDITEVAVGDHVVLSGLGCGRCRYCAIAMPMLCLSQFQRGPINYTNKGQNVFHFAQATFSEWSVVPINSCIKIRQDAPLDKVCLIGCGVTTGVLSAINTAKVRPGSTCLVIGCGGVGLNVVQGCAIAGARMIIAADILDNKLEMAKTFGATHTINSKSGDLVAQVKALTDGFGVDFSFEVIARGPTIEMAFESLAPNGLCTVVGAAPPGTIVHINTDLLFYERGIRGVFLGSPRPGYDTPMLVDMYMAGKLKLDELVSQNLSIDGINQAFADMKGGKVARTVIKYA